MVAGKTTAPQASFWFPHKKTRREPRKLRGPAATEKDDRNDLEIELDAHLDLPLKSQSVTGGG